MNIQDWPIDKIMMLPDHLFGRRWLLRDQANLAVNDAEVFISKSSLPDRCVIWEIRVALLFESSNEQDEAVRVRLGLSDDPNIGLAAALTMEPVFHGVGEFASSELGGTIDCKRLRHVIEPQGKKFVWSFASNASIGVAFFADVVISSLPTRIPDSIARDYRSV